MKKNYLFLFLITLILTSCTTNKHLVIIDKDNNQEFILPKDEVFEISLNSNPTTGYQWTIEKIDSSYLYQLGESEYSSESTLMGGGGIETYKFKTLKEGETELLLLYRRSWEDEIPADSFHVIIIIN